MSKCAIYGYVENDKVSSECMYAPKMFQRKYRGNVLENIGVETNLPHSSRNRVNEWILSFSNDFVGKKRILLDYDLFIL